MKNILDIIYDYSKKYKILDETAINKIMDELFRINDFQDISFNVITNKVPFNRDLGTLDYKDIYIYLYNLNKKIKKNDYRIESHLEEELPLFEKFIRMNCVILLTCLHECEHVLQDKMLEDKNDDTLEKKLIRIESDYLDSIEQRLIHYDPIDKALCFIPDYIFLAKSKRIYDFNYDISLLERLANLNAYEKIKLMLKEIENELTKLMALMDQIILTTQMETYVDKWGPTLLFFDKIGYYSRAYQYESLSIPYEDRIRFGLNLTDEEYETNKEKILKIKSI